MAGLARLSSWLIFATGMLLGLRGGAEPLPSLLIDPTKVSVSGLSSGAFFAIQFATAHSSKVSGVGSFAGGVYHCAEGEVVRATTVCMKEPQALDIQRPLDELKKNAASGLVDDLVYLSRQKVFLFHGKKDTVMNPVAAEKLVDFYRALGVIPQTSFDSDSGHGFPSEQVSGGCETNAKPWMTNCGFDGVGDLFRTLFGNLQPPAPMKRQNLWAFSQSEYDLNDASMSEEGWIYVPSACRQGGCALHIVFHGCQQNPAAVGEQFVTKTGYTNWAESNNIVILFPTASVSKKNPQGCWDWYGYTGKDYGLKSGRQIMTVHRMLNQLKQPPVKHWLPQTFLR